MAIIYRTAGVWGAGKGSDLGAAEVDGNFYDHEGRIADLEGAGIGVGIDYISVTGDQMTIVMTDHTSQGPFTLPTTDWEPRGAWAPLTIYAAMDVVTYNGAAYIVKVAHTSASTFDASATDGGGNNLYKMVLSNPNIGVFNITATTFTPDLTHTNQYVRFTATAGCAITLPLNLYSIGAELHFRNANVQGLTFDILSGGSLLPPDGFGLACSTNGGNVDFKLVDVASNIWDVYGLLDLA